MIMMNLVLIVVCVPLGVSTFPWGTVLVTVLVSLIAVGGFIWSFVLDTRYTGPYTLLRANLRQKLRWAFYITFWQTLVIPALGVIIPMIVPEYAQWPVFTLTCLGAWLVLLPIGVFVRRDRMDWILKRYIRAYHTMMTGNNPYVPPRTLAHVREQMNPEIERFLEEGYRRD
jgi:hypothetical protein